MQYGKLIRDTAKKLGKTRRELSYEWKKAVREISNEQMSDPNKYSLISKDMLYGETDTLDLYDIIKQRFLDNVTEQDTVEDDAMDATEAEVDAAEAEFNDELTDSMEEEIISDESESTSSGDDFIDSISDFGDFLGDTELDLDNDESDDEITESDDESDSEITFDDIISEEKAD